VIETVRETVMTALLAMNYDVSELEGDVVLGPAGLALESLAVAEMAVRLEDAFGIRFADEEIAELADATIDEFCATVAGRVEAHAAVGDPR
jgi:acyl carrier protein